MIDMIVLEKTYFQGRWRSVGETIEATDDEAVLLSLANVAEYANPASSELVTKFSDDELTRLMAVAVRRIAEWQLSFVRLSDVARTRGLLA